MNPGDARTLDEVPAAQATAMPGAVALRGAAGSLTFAALEARVDAAAALLHAQWGVRPGDRVAWLGANDVAQVVLLFALARIGAAWLPMNFRLSEAEWQRLLDACSPCVLVHGEGFGDAAAPLARRRSIPCIAAVELMAESSAPAPRLAAPTSPVLLVQTSGTTGGPRVAVHTQANLLANMRIAAHAQAITPGDVVLTVLPLFHVGGLCIQTLPALYAGATVILHPRFSPDDVLACIADERPTLTLQVPATMKALIEHPAWAATDLSSLRAMWAGSSVIPREIVDAIHARKVPVCNVYGATETGPFSIALPPEHAFTHAGSCGWTAQGVEARLVEAGRPGEVKEVGEPGVAGEIMLRGANIVARYWPDIPALDGDGWFRTGDLATRAADGSYTIVGRAKELIISGGENIHPMEIEQVLSGHPSVAECAAFGVPDARWGEAVAVAVVLGSPANESELRGHLDGRLARFKHPRHWHFVDALPKTALGKVRRGELAAALIRPSPKASNEPAPRA
ncbi:class I adenylate-forming enzyme family protein [Ramlibacter sp.]|uniref:class I adenylate-forming enzyme family protein n=1 Tax=Ramlibacter sp. TaxID=1917967 RepID=UPI003D12CE9A